MSDGARTAATLAGLCMLLVVASLWGWSAATKPFPQDEEVPICVDAEVATGEEVYADNVVVSVYNGSGRQRLAASTQDLLVERGFVAGPNGNAPERTKATLIVTDDPDSPAVALVRRQFRGARVVDGRQLGTGVTVILGEGFGKLRAKAPSQVVSKVDTTYCKASGSA